MGLERRRMLKLVLTIASPRIGFWDYAADWARAWIWGGSGNGWTEWYVLIILLTFF